MAGWAEEIVGEIALGDERLNERLVALVEALAERPGESIPEACQSWAATCAAYRFFDNERVEAGAIIAGAAQATVRRCQGQGVVLAVQDSTSLDYTRETEAEGLGPLESANLRGLFVHSTLAVSTAGVPLGLIGQEVWARDPEDIGKRRRRKYLPVEAKESAKWLRALKRTEQCLSAAGILVVTVADREADVYELFALAQEGAGQWLIRACRDRQLADQEEKLLGAVESASPCVCATVELSRADDHPARRAKLELRRAEVVLQPPRREKGALAQWWAEHPEVGRLAPQELRPVAVGVILVTEVDAPQGVKPLRWLLLTSLPVNTPEQVLLCVGYYRLRWLAERYHYVLKSGCRVEQLQLETAERLKRALGVCALVAWRLLWLTYEARAHPQAPCTLALDEEQWRVLVAVGRPTALASVEPPSLQEAVLRIAKLGGFLGRKHDGAPGVKTLWRGMTRLNDMVLAYRALREQPDLLSESAPATYV